MQYDQYARFELPFLLIRGDESEVEEMFGTEAFTKKIMRLLAKGAVAGAAASVVFLETEATI